MENTSKALIIAGAVLITIILISIGIRILAPSSEMSENYKERNVSVEVQMFNSKITPYLGNKVSGTDVRSLLSYLMVYDSNSKATHKILINGYSLIKEGGEYKDSKHCATIPRIQELYDAIFPDKTYKVVITNGCGTYKNGYCPDGKIGCISITKN